jgi:hypothetical protein
MKFIINVFSVLTVFTLVACNSSTTEQQDVAQDDTVQVYKSTVLNIQFNYPKDWFVEEDKSTQTVYIRNVAKAVTKETMPPTFEQLWITTNEEFTSKDQEELLRFGTPIGIEVFGDVQADTMQIGDITMNVYTFKTIGGMAKSVFWQDANNVRYFATHSNEVGEQNQKSMGENLLEVLRSVQSL